MSDTFPAEVDVAIIGGGPAGSVAATTLAQAGRSVLVVERREFPRFHIGESMTPYMIAVFDRLKVLDRLKEKDYPVKKGAEFIFRDGGHWRVPLAAQGPGRPDWTVQVTRSSFDELLIEHARDSGAQVLMNANVTSVVMDEDDRRVVGIEYEKDLRRHVTRARYVIDAAGRPSKLAAKFNLRKWLPQLRNIAIYRHFENFDDTKGPNVPGDIQVAGHKDGWVWAIPTSHDVISIGAVMSKSTFADISDRPLEEIFNDHVGRTPRLVERLKGTRPHNEIRLETDYGYYAEKMSGPGWFIVGDAGCFVDPIFSAGVWLATATAWIAARRIGALLEAPGDEAAVQDEFDRFCKTGFDMYARMCFAFYDAFTHESESQMSARLDAVGIDVNSVEFGKLIGGDFWDAGNGHGQIMRGNPAWDFFEPFERTGYCPVYGNEE